MAGPGSDDYLDSLRLSPQQQEEILATLTEGTQEGPGAERRVEPRVAYHRQAGLIVQMRHPGGSVENYLVRVRNLSKSGIAFLHGNFVYTGTRCSVALLTTDNRSMKVEGQVARCQHVQKHVHDVGVRFDQQIRLRDFVPGGLLMGPTEASQELPRLSGRVLYVEDSVSDQELMRFHLSNLGVEVQAVSDGMAALEQVGSGKFDAVLTGVWLRTLSGLEIARGLRQAGYTGPIIAITADEQEETRQKALSCGCSQVLVKPYQFTELADALARHLPAASAQSDEAPALASAYWSDQQMQSLIRTFVERLVGQVAEMQRQISRARLDMPLQKLCMEIKGAAGGYGYPQISQAAQRLLRMIKQDAGAASVHGQLMELQQLAQSAQAFIGEQSAGLPVRRDPAVKATT